MVAAGAQSIPGSSADAHAEIDADAETVPGVIGIDADAERVPGVIEALPGIVDRCRRFCSNLPLKVTFVQESSKSAVD
eukprot:4069368-Amphidinium_carterae.2